MALFSRKKKKDSHHDDGINDGIDFSKFEALDDHEDLSAQNYPVHNYDEWGDVDDDDPLGIDKKDKDNKRDTKEEGVHPLVKIFVIIAAIAALVMGVNYVMNNSDTSPSSSSSQDDNNNGDDSKPAVKGSDEGIVVTEDINKKYKSSDNGNPANGTGAILAFDYAYYVDRDGKKARELFNPDVKEYSAEYIQREINKIPQGVKHELSITPQVIGEKYDVILTLTIPGSDPVSYKQTFQTMKKDDKFYVKSFETSSSGESSSELDSSSQ